MGRFGSLSVTIYRRRRAVANKLGPGRCQPPIRATCGPDRLRPAFSKSSVVAQRVDQLALAHPGASLDADLLGGLIEIASAPVLVGGRLAAALAGPAAPGVGDPRCLLLARALLLQRLVLLVVLDLRTMVLGHRSLLGRQIKPTSARGSGSLFRRTPSRKEAWVGDDARLVGARNMLLAPASGSR